MQVAHSKTKNMCAVLLIHAAHKHRIIHPDLHADSVPLSFNMKTLDLYILAFYLHKNVMYQSYSASNKHQHVTIIL